jgi:hypothetical protein
MHASNATCFWICNRRSPRASVELILFPISWKYRVSQLDNSNTLHNMANIQPFEIEIPDTQLDTLKRKLSLATFPDEVSFSNDPKYGTPLNDIKRLVAYWKDGYDWRKHEARLNQLPHFTTTVNVDGFGDLGIHFLHQKSTRTDAIPLLFCHGCELPFAYLHCPVTDINSDPGPGGFWEPIKMLDLLAEPADASQPAFHVVAPSLPNYGFSEGVNKPDFGLRQYAETIHKLMLQLNYDKYGTCLQPSPPVPMVPLQPLP